MKPGDRALIVSELSWLHEDPERVSQLLTDQEREKIVRQGFVCGEIWTALQARLKTHADLHQSVVQ